MSLTTIFRKKQEKPRALSGEYFAKYYSKKGINLTFTKPDQIDLDNGIYTATAVYELAGSKIETHLRVLSYTELYDECEKIALQIKVDRIGIAEHERREFLQKQNFKEVIDSCAAMIGTEAVMQCCVDWILKSQEKVA